MVLGGYDPDGETQEVAYPEGKRSSHGTVLHAHLRRSCCCQEYVARESVTIIYTAAIPDSHTFQGLVSRAAARIASGALPIFEAGRLD